MGLKVSARLYLMLVCHIISITAWRNFDIVILNVTCDAHAKVFKKFECFLKTTPENLTSVNVYMIPSKDFYPQLVHSKTDLISDTQKITNLANIEMDGCQFLENVGQNSLMNQVTMSALKDPRISNTPKRCPFLKNKEYYVKDYTFDPEKYPPFIPTFKFNSSLLVFESKIKILHYELRAKFKAKRREKKRSKH